MEISGADSAVESGDVVSLLCTSMAARPAAVLTWYNGTSLFPEQPAGQVPHYDHDYEDEDYDDLQNDNQDWMFREDVKL